MTQETRLTEEDCAKIQADVDSGTDNPVTRAVIRALLSDRAALQRECKDLKAKFIGMRLAALAPAASSNKEQENDND